VKKEEPAVKEEDMSETRSDEESVETRENEPDPPGAGEGEVAGEDESDSSETEVSGEMCTCTAVEDNVRLPHEFFGLKDLSQVVNLETWKEVLNEKERMYLRQYLPMHMDEAAGGSLDKLLGGEETFHFGNPSKRFMRDILSGLCHPSVVKFRSILGDLNFNMFFHRLREHHNQMVEGLVAKEKERQGNAEETAPSAQQDKVDEALPPKKRLKT